MRHHTSSRLALVRWLSLAALAACTLTPGRADAAQPCDGDPEGWEGSVWAQNSLKYWDGGIRKPIKLADPTILKLQDNAIPPRTWFFITGTDSGQWFDYQGVSKGIGMTNFAIYRSTNLVDWYFHSFVFDRAMQGIHSWDADTMFMPASASTPPRFFKRFGSPSLHYDPNNGDGIIYLTFSAAELFVPNVGLGIQGDNDLDGDQTPDPGQQFDPRPDYDLDGNATQSDVDPLPGDAAAQQQTAFVIWTEKSRLLQGKPWMTPSDTNGQPFRTWFPIMYHYRLNNTGGWKRDGGVAQAAANGDGYASIPTTGTTNYSNRYIIDEVEIPGYAWHAPWGFHWAGVGPRAWPQVDINTYYDSSDNCQPWLVWTWAQRSGYSWDTNNVAAYPLLGGPHSTSGFRLADALYQNPNFAPPNNTQPLQLFYAYDPDTIYFGNIPNGKVRANLATNAPELHPYGVAEAGAVFRRTADNGTTWTYAMATRNAWNQPSYQVVYRRASSIEALHLPWGGVPTNANEHVLLASNWIQRWDGTRDSGNRTNFGNAHYFHAYGYDYLLFHKLPNTADPVGTSRQVFISNLHFSSDGWPYRIYDYFPNPFGHFRDANWYSAPNVSGLSTPPVP